MVRGSRHNDYKINALNKGSKIHEAKTKRIEETDNSATIVGDFITLLSIIDRTPKQSINKKKEDLNHTVSQLYLTDVYKHSTPKEQDTHSFSNAHFKFFRIDHMSCHKISLKRF